MPTRLDFGPFLALSEPDREALAARARPVNLSRGGRLIRAGEPAAAAFAVLGGRIRVVGPDGDALATMTAPALAGELAVLEGRAHRSDVVALTAVRAVRVDADDLRRLVAADARFATALGAFADARRANAFLRRQGPFTTLPSDEIEDLAARLRPYRARAGEVLVRQGERGDDLFLIRDGEVEALRADGSGERVLARLGPGSLVGEIAVLTGSPRIATVRALTDVDALMVPGEDVRAVVKRHRELLRRVTSVMQARHAPRRTGEHRVEPAPDDPDAAIVSDPRRGAYLRLDRQALEIYRDLDGERTIRDLSLRHFERTGTLDPKAVFSTVASLQLAGFASSPRVAAATPAGPLLRVLDAVLAPRAEIGDVDAIAARLLGVLRPLFTRPAAAAAAVVGAAGLLVALPVLRTASPTDFGLGGIAVAFAGLLLAGVGHEVAHALAAKAEGARLGRAGIGLFWFTPVVYVDTSATWAIPRLARIRVNVAGPLFNLALAGLCALAARSAGGAAQDVLVWLALTNVVLVAFNLSPFLEFDGYYVLADLTDTNALRRKAMRSVFADLGRPRRPASRGEAAALAYVLACVAYVAVMCVVAVAGIPSAVVALAPSGIAGMPAATVAFAVGAILVVLLVLPLVLEALDARRRPGPVLA